MCHYLEEESEPEINWNQKIVVNIEYLDNAIDSIPGITICYDSGLSFEKIAERFEEYKKVNDKYL